MCIVKSNTRFPPEINFDPVHVWNFIDSFLFVDVLLMWEIWRGDLTSIKLTIKMSKSENEKFPWSCQRKVKSEDTEKRMISILDVRYVWSKFIFRNIHIFPQFLSSVRGRRAIDHTYYILKMHPWEILFKTRSSLFKTMFRHFIRASAFLLQLVIVLGTHEVNVTVFLLSLSLSKIKLCCVFL